MGKRAAKAGVVGSQRRRTVIDGATRREVVERLKARHGDQFEGPPSVTDKQAFGPFLYRWLRPSRSLPAGQDRSQR